MSNQGSEFGDESARWTEPDEVWAEISADFERGIMPHQVDPSVMEDRLNRFGIIAEPEPTLRNRVERWVDRNLLGFMGDKGARP